MASRLIPALALVGCSPLAAGFVLIDDFTVGGYTEVFTSQDFSREERGLDRQHSAFGTRKERLSMVNPLGLPVTIAVGNGEARVSYPSPLANQNFLEFGIDRDWTIDISAESEIRFDVYTENPAERFADVWRLTIENGNGQGASNGRWVRRPNGIAFRRQDFDNTIDWSNIQFMMLRQDWDDSGGPQPLVYSVTEVYAVPEPTALTTFGVLLCYSLLRLAASSKHSDCL